MPQITRPYTNWFAGTPVNESEQYGPFQPQQPDAGEFSLAGYIPTTLSNAVKNASRMFDSNKTILDQNAESGPQPAWYDFSGRVSAAASSVNSAFQSTLIKIIIILVIVSTVYLVFLSKVGQLANGK